MRDMDREMENNDGLAPRFAAFPFRHSGHHDKRSSKDSCAVDFACWLVMNCHPKSGTYAVSA